MIRKAAGTGGASLLCFCISESGDETWKMVALVMKRNVKPGVAFLLVKKADENSNKRKA